VRSAITAWRKSSASWRRFRGAYSKVARVSGASMPQRKAHMTDSTAVYTGVFDPVHLGHLDIIRRGSRIFDRLVVGVGNNPEKASFFSVEERVELVQQVVQDIGNVEVRPFLGLAVRFVREVNARIM